MTTDKKKPKYGEIWQRTQTGGKYQIEGFSFNAITDCLDVFYSPLAVGGEHEIFNRQLEGHEKAFLSPNEDGSPRFAKLKDALSKQSNSAIDTDELEKGLVLFDIMFKELETEYNVEDAKDSKNYEAFKSVYEAAKAHLEALKQEPVGYTVHLRTDKSFYTQSRIVRSRRDALNTVDNYNSVLFYDDLEKVIVPLYTTPQPAEQPVLNLPESVNVSLPDSEWYVAFNSGRNAAIKDIIKMNPHLKVVQK